MTMIELQLMGVVAGLIITLLLTIVTPDEGQGAQVEGREPVVYGMGVPEWCRLMGVWCALGVLWVLAELMAGLFRLTGWVYPKDDV